MYNLKLNKRYISSTLDADLNDKTINDMINTVKACYGHDRDDIYPNMQQLLLRLLHIVNDCIFSGYYKIIKNEGNFQKAAQKLLKVIPGRYTRKDIETINRTSNSVKHDSSDHVLNMTQFHNAVNSYNNFIRAFSSATSTHSFDRFLLDPSQKESYKSIKTVTKIVTNYKTRVLTKVERVEEDYHLDAKESNMNGVIKQTKRNVDFERICIKRAGFFDFKDKKKARQDIKETKSEALANNDKDRKKRISDLKKQKKELMQKIKQNEGKGVLNGIKNMINKRIVKKSFDKEKKKIDKEHIKNQKRIKKL